MTLSMNFVNIENKLAKEIVEQRTGDRVDEVNISSNRISRKNKNSSDCNEIDVIILKNDRTYSKKHMHISVISPFLTGIFPSNMKTVSYSHF